MPQTTRPSKSEILDKIDVAAEAAAAGEQAHQWAEGDPRRDFAIARAGDLSSDLMDAILSYERIPERSAEPREVRSLWLSGRWGAALLGNVNRDGFVLESMTFFAPDEIRSDGD